MKNRRILFCLAASVTLTGALCFAQETMVGISINRPSDGSVSVQITNHRQAALTAYVLEVDRVPAAGNGASGQSILYFDSLLNPWQNKSFAPGETRMVRVAGRARGTASLQVEPALKAAVFEDGATFGDNDSVARIIAARKMFFSELGKAVSLIKLAQTSSMSRDELIREASQNLQSDLASAQYPEEKRAVANPWSTLQTNLQRNSTLPADTIEGTMLQMFMHLRQALILSKPAVAPPGATVNPAN